MVEESLEYSGTVFKDFDGGDGWCGEDLKRIGKIKMNIFGNILQKINLYKNDKYY